jgi:hypothetical protein
VDAQVSADAAVRQPHANFAKCDEMAQNEGDASGTSREQSVRTLLEMMWNEGPGGGHYNNMVNKQYKQVAVGIYVQPDGRL